MFSVSPPSGNFQSYLKLDGKKKKYLQGAIDRRREDHFIIEGIEIKVQDITTNELGSNV